MRKKINFPIKLDKLSRSVYYPLIEKSFLEDLDEVGDITTKALIYSGRSEAELVAKEEGIICGIELFEESFLYVDKTLNIEKRKKDGDYVACGECVAHLSGDSASILTAERTALNFISFLSGISTRVNKLVKKIKGSPTKLLDTRKTLPGLRMLEKYAVSVGGGYNHRLGLYDMILIKENHIYAVGSIKEAVRRAKEFRKDIIVEVEIQTIEQVDEVLETEAEIVMLDNMNDYEVEKAFAMLKDSKYVEVSGNITEERLISLSKLGVDFVSMGALTHTLKPLDLTLLIKA